MIAETSGPCIVVFTGDSVFLYSVDKVDCSCDSRMGKRCFHCYKFCLSSHSPVVSGSHVSGSRVTGPCLSALRVPAPRSQVLILDYAPFLLP